MFFWWKVGLCSIFSGKKQGGAIVHFKFIAVVYNLVQKSFHAKKRKTQREAFACFFAASVS